MLVVLIGMLWKSVLKEERNSMKLCCSSEGEQLCSMEVVVSCCSTKVNEVCTQAT